MNAGELKRSLTTEDIIDFVVKMLKSEEPRFDGSGNPIFTTVCHGGDSHKLYYYEDSQIFHCYTDTCGSFDIYELIQKSGYASDFIEAYQILCDYFGYNPFGRDFDAEPEKVLTSDWDLFTKIDSFSKNKNHKKKSASALVPTNMLEFYSPIIPAIWMDEGISYDTMKKFGIRVDIAGQKAIIPHWDLNGNLVGIRGRNFNDEDLQNIGKYMPVCIERTWYNHPLGENLYGLNFSRKAIEKIKKVIIYEAEKSVMLNHTYYGEDSFAVAVCGSALSDTQVNLLLSLGVNEIIIAFDNETDGLVGSQMTVDYKAKIESIASQFAPYVNTYYIMDYWNKLGYKDSPADKGKETLEFLLKHKFLVRSINSGLIQKSMRKRK